MAGLIILLACAVFLPAHASGESFNSKISQAMDHYQNQQYGEAAKKFLSAEVNRPKNPALAYNRANSHYMNEKYEEALEAYTRAEAATATPALKQKALYNIGNSLYRLGKNEEAALAYKKALEIDSSDMDAKFNLEFVREQIKKQDQKDKEGQGEKDKEDQSAQGDKGDGDDGDKEDQQDPSDQGRQSEKADESAPPPPPDPGESDSPSDGGDGQEQSPAAAQADSGELSEEEAERWLSSLTEDHKKFSRKQAQGNMKDLFNYKGKDW